MNVPAAIIVVGASRNQAKYGNRAVRAYKEAGAEVFPINPRVDQVEGVPAYSSVDKVPPGKATVATVYVPPDVSEPMLPALAAYGIKTIFFNPGAERDDVVAKTRALGMQPILACSITAIGRNPEKYAPR